ncbi:predicted protein [Naegleria gruberi]|uniref:Predicted protein n=1 Tax=Naegleria gruberi TaxID=5762 RepID=D2W6A1_NAEGR|nr:uncharacterized protein NAEGRDRAFT_54938 [Naegleria gruberi]EFC35402.1 predicted protein [Naegleria gruberi]|eukprot:XP_002668146.1 predicted protein [Naegleria gruberi strain NEG-M]
MSQSIPRFIQPSSSSSRSRSSSNANSDVISSSPSHLSSSPSMMEYYKKSSGSSPLSKEEEELMNQKKERFQTCKEVIDRLNWDESLADVMQNLAMIYKDRFEGDVFISYSEYENSELKEDLPQHRIQSLIYRDEHVFWDKNKRIDLITSKEIFPIIDSYLNPTEPIDETSQGAEIKKKKKKNSKPSISLEKSKASTLLKTTSGENLEDDEEDEIDQYIAEYDEEYGMYLK